jgi:ferritin-like metal-binding protein YciE
MDVAVPRRTVLGLDDAVGLLEETLKEENDTDATLTKMAESVINQSAEAAE